MMSMLEIETKHLIMSGLQNIQNPFFEGMVEKNSYSIGDEVTPFGVAFYVTPFINAIVRSGEPQEKELVFSSFLKYKAYEKIPSTKRGHKQGEMETVLQQALRVCTNVKNRQTRTQDAGLTMLENLIEENHMLDNHKILLFLLEPGQIDRNIAGLIANKFMAKYQRPCCILTKVVEYKKDMNGIPPWDDRWLEIALSEPTEKISYQGSARNYDKSGFTDFKDLCSVAPGVLYAEGHQGAFGLGISADKIEDFITYMDIQLEELDSEPAYYCDYCFDWDFYYDRPEFIWKCILDLYALGDLWGKDMEEALIGIENIKVSSNMVQIFEKKKNTIKINMPGFNIMKFDATEEECNLFKYNNDGYIKINVVGSCNRNEWGGNITPQLFITDYEVVYKQEYTPSAEDF